MKRLIVDAALMALAGGSSMSGTNEQRVVEKVASMLDGSFLSAQDLRQKFHGLTGSNLVEPDSLRSYWNVTCSFEKPKEAYNPQLS